MYVCGVMLNLLNLPYVALAQGAANSMQSAFRSRAAERTQGK